MTLRNNFYKGENKLKFFFYSILCSVTKKYLAKPHSPLYDIKFIVCPMNENIRSKLQKDFENEY